MTRRRVAIACVCRSTDGLLESADPAHSFADCGATAQAQQQRRQPLLISALDTATRLFGSDGKTHLEYDLTLQNVFDAPVTVTSIEVLDAAGESLMTMDEKKVAAFTRPVFQRSANRSGAGRWSAGHGDGRRRSARQGARDADPQDQLPACGIAECRASGNPRRRRPGRGGREPRPRHDRAAVTRQRVACD